MPIEILNMQTALSLLAKDAVSFFSYRSADDEAFNDIEKILQGKGFAQEGIGPQFGTGGFVGRIGGHGDKFDFRVGLLDKLKQVKSAFTRKVDLREEQVNRTAGLQIGLQTVAVFKGHDFTVDTVHHDVDNEVAGKLLMINDSDFDVRYDSVPSCDF